MRATTLLNSLLGLRGVAVVDPGSWLVELGGGEIVVRVRLTRRLLVCPECSYATAYRYDTREVDSSWRHRDFGGRVCRIKGAVARAAVSGAWGARRGGAVRAAEIGVHA
ncbi:MAG: hypothetical protein ACRDQ4_26170 [Pseudonocardiaceae bacterium]